MEFTYENQGINTYLCCELTDMKIDTMGLGMITNNHIQGFVPSVFTQMNGRKFVKYNVSSKISMKQFFSGQVNRKRLVNVFAGIAELLIQAEEYMLDVNSIVLDTDYIFINVPDCVAEVIYVPAVLENSGQEVAMFFKNIMFSAQFDSSEDCDYVTKIINFLNQAGVFSVSEFKKLLEKLKRQSSEKSGIAGKAYVSEDTGVMGNKNMAPRENTVENTNTPGKNAELGIRPVNTAENKVEQKQVFPGAQAELSKMQIPGGQSISDIAKRENGTVLQESLEKQISLFYLLQHYNKENAELYKAQKEGQKQKTDGLSEKQPKGKNKREKQQKVKPQKDKKAETAVSYAVPGQQGIPKPSGQQNMPIAPGQQNMSGTSGQKAVQGASARQMSAFPSSEMKPEAVPVAEQQATFNDNFGETEYMSQEDDGGTVLMGEDGGMQVIQPYLIRLKNNERIPLDRGILSIGRSKDLVDYVIPDNKFVGHYHCHILSRDGEFFIVDDNSKNHTYVSGTEIQSNVEVKLSHNMIFSVANEEFEVRLF